MPSRPREHELPDAEGVVVRQTGAIRRRLTLSGRHERKSPVHRRVALGYLREVIVRDVEAQCWYPLHESESLRRVPREHLERLPGSSVQRLHLVHRLLILQPEAQLPPDHPRPTGLRHRLAHAHGVADVN